MSLRPISVEFLAPGMQIKGDIYGSNNGVFVLVTQDTVLTASAIKRLQGQLKVSQNIYVTEDTYQKLIKQGLPKSLTQKNIETQLGYTDLKETTASMMDDIRITGKIDVKKTEETISSVSEKVRNAEGTAILQCINGVREVDEYLYQHSINVSFMNGLISKWLGLSDEEIEIMATVGILHDTGKVRVPVEILQKPGRLTASEFEEMKAHPAFGTEILQASGVKDDRIIQGVLQHHEKRNGKGYPGGLVNDEISIYAKVTSISDIYDAMVAKRVYKQEQSPFYVLEIFSRNKVIDLDMEIVSLFLDKMPSELLHKRVLLSDGSIGQIVFIDSKDYAHPIVNVDGKIIPTGPEIEVMRMIV